VGAFHGNLPHVALFIDVRKLKMRNDLEVVFIAARVEEGRQIGEVHRD
jgi:hypothetical protein